MLSTVHPQIMNVGLPQTASSEQCPGSSTVPLTSLISAFMSPPSSLKLPPQPHDCWEPSPPCNAPCTACLAARDRCSKQLHKPKWIILLKTTRWKNIPHLIAVSTTTSGCLQPVSLTNYWEGAGKSGVCSLCTWWLIWIIQKFGWARLFVQLNSENKLNAEGLCEMYHSITAG